MITILTNGRLLDCVGDEPQENISIVIEDGWIKDIYRREKPTPSGALTIDVGLRTILPGLTDAHQHPAITHIDFHRLFKEAPIVTALKIKGNLERTLQAGFTTIAEMGMGNWAMKQAVEDGFIKGPRLLLACAMISKTGGHGDFCIRGDPTLLPIKDTGIFSLPRVVDGVDDALKAAREQFRAGADHLKAMATGGCASPNDSIWDMGFTEEELRTLVKEADEMGKYVAVHALNDAGVKRAILCGVRSVDHGMFMSEDSARMMKERGIFHVPTITAPYMLKKYGRDWGMQDYLEKKTTEAKLLEEQFKCTELTLRHGVTIGSGSDAFGEVCGKEGFEIKFKTECGFTPYEAIKSATIVNAKLFMMEDKIGSIEVGKWADMIVVDGHPDEDPSLFCDPHNVKLVMKKGVIFKNIMGA
jgi:imidazolonepropionase-like amidohydrolase